MAKGKYRNKRLAAQQAAEQAAQEKAAADAASKEATAPTFQTKDGPGSGKNLTDLDFELQAAQRAAGMEENVYGIGKLLWPFMKWYDSKRKPHTFKKKTYLWLMLFTGWMGGHRWYQGRRILGLLSTVFFWTGIPLILCVTDFMEVFPIKADENGLITMK